MPRRNRTPGFTLIEIAIVLVVIVLVVGGILVGKNLIDAAGIRAQIFQIEKYNQAANTFKGKYGYLPGDIPNPDATRFGFLSRGTQAGQGDGNGIIQGYGDGELSGAIQAGEPVMFWVDLSTANMVDGTFNTAVPHRINARRNSVGASAPRSSMRSSSDNDTRTPCSSNIARTPAASSTDSDASIESPLQKSAATPVPETPRYQPPKLDAVLFAAPDFEETRAAGRANAFGCGPPVLHRDLRSVFHLALTLAFYAVCFRHQTSSHPGE
jgi:type II secretory pathway pseudopilin PulG